MSETPRVLRKKLDAPRFDALDGEDCTEAGWIVVRPMGEEVWNFKSLSGILTALNTGVFGLTIRSTVEEGENVATPWSDEPWEDTPVCPEETCESCPEPWTCAGLRAAEVPTDESLQMVWKVNSNNEPLGWSAPENCR